MAPTRGLVLFWFGKNHAVDIEKSGKIGVRIAFREHCAGDGSMGSLKRPGKQLCEGVCIFVWKGLTGMVCEDFRSDTNDIREEDGRFQAIRFNDREWKIFVEFGGNNYCRCSRHKGVKHILGYMPEKTD